jgi:hypothetical protein
MGAFAVVFPNRVINRGRSESVVVQEGGDPLPRISIFKLYLVAFALVGGENRTGLELRKY